MGYVHTHWRPGIQGYDSLKHIRSDVEKIGEDNQKVGKIGQTISQMFALGPKHDKIWTQLASSIISKNMDRSKKCLYVEDKLEGADDVNVICKCNGILEDDKSQNGRTQEDIMPKPKLKLMQVGWE